MVAWEKMRKASSFLRLSPFLTNLASNWGNFSRFYCDYFMLYSTSFFNDYCPSERKFAFFQLWFLTQMNHGIRPRSMPIIKVNQRHFHFLISRKLGWSIFRISWARKIVSKVCKVFTSIQSSRYDKYLFKQSYLERYGDFQHKMMHQIIMRLMAYNSSIFRHTI